MERLKNRNGETLIETLTALVIVVLVIVFFSTAAITAARLNGLTKKADTSFHYDTRGTATKGTVLISKLPDSAGAQSIDVTMYQDNGYYFYSE